ncbi:MAG: hypothetical protein A3I78_07050 [Gammaproteobacteria bacterium RIFCSPLOWO2_02_FULL_56_15]|nr:MAG: hypothetical protein A3I78_07050 [Gammaproteobacteria bacterium RIFCSPLOWO2_02_FULL_56_15]
MAAIQNSDIEIELVYAGTTGITRIPLRVEAGTTIREAMDRSGILTQCPEIRPDVNRVGIFSRLRDMDTPLAAGDRVEIYRPLRADPKEARRQRARQQQTGKR